MGENFIKLKAYAKINLSLDVVGKREDGYHNLEMIMQTIDIYDNIFLQASDDGITVKCNAKYVPSGDKNIAFKAASLFMDRYNIKKGIKIEIEKNIPVAAGLAGGSTDAASVLKGLNRLFNMNLSDDELCELGIKVGADVPYCIKGGTMLAEGVGEILSPIKPLKNVDIVLVKPDIGVSTPWVFKNFNMNNVKKRPHTKELIKAVENRDLGYLGTNMRNVLETVTVKEHPIIEKIKYDLLESGAIGSMMSGSGPSTFGIFADRESAEKCFEKIKDSMWQCFLTKTI